jgi:hypothetical protein
MSPQFNPQLVIFVVPFSHDDAWCAIFGFIILEDALKYLLTYLLTYSMVQDIF